MASLIDIVLACAELLLLYAVALLLGKVIGKLPKTVGKVVKVLAPDVATESWPPLPEFLGMLLAGILLANVPGDVLGAVPPIWSTYIRKAALTIILTRAGLSLDIAALRSLGAATLRLASIPCILEATTAAVVAKLLRSDMSWGLCFCLGFILAAVSPAVVVPSLLALQDGGYGGHIPTMVLAAASLDDVIAICGLGIGLDIAFTQIEGGGGQSTIIWTALLAPITVVAGLFVGFTVGGVQFLLTKYGGQSSIILSDHFRSVLLLLSSLVIVYVSSAYQFDAAGYLAVMVGGFVLARGWDLLEESSDPARQYPGFTGEKAVSANFKVLWAVFMPALFMLIGAQVDLADISTSQLGYAIIVLLVGLAARLVVTFTVAGIGTGMSVEEKMFVAIAWFPKATVQAALGSVVLDRAQSLTVDDDSVASDTEDIGKFILTAAILAIILTAPVGAIGIYIVGPLWLKRDEDKAADSTTGGRSLELRSAEAVLDGSRHSGEAGEQELRSGAAIETIIDAAA